MKCQHHPNAELETITTKVQQKVPWQEEYIISYTDIEYCTECFLEHEKGKPMRLDLITDKQDYLEQQVENYIESQIDKRIH
jgi:hypothetical protein